MRWRMRFVAAAVALGAACGAFVAPAQAQTFGEDSAIGDVITLTSPGPTGFVFDAHSGPSGENPSGTAAYLYFRADFFLRGPVTCLTVTGNRATIGFENQEPGAPPSRLFLFVEDNGTPEVGTDKAAAQFLPVVPTICPPNTYVYSRFDTVEDGDLTVHDAQPFPTSKDPCKNGGWRTYGVFKNQGDCVSFVATKVKNPPANSL